jgi:hypothetical protein
VVIFVRFFHPAILGAGCFWFNSHRSLSLSNTPLSLLSLSLEKEEWVR